MVSSIRSPISASKEKNPIPFKELHFVVGAAVFPVLLNVHIAAHKILDSLGFESNDLEGWGKRVVEQINLIQGAFFEENPEIFPLQIPIQLTETIGKTVLFQDFIQSYLLDKNLTKLLKKIAPEWQNFSNSTCGKVSRVILTSLLFTAFQPLLRWHNNGLLATKINDLVTGLFSATLRELLGTSLPAISLNMLRDYLSPID